MPVGWAEALAGMLEARDISDQGTGGCQSRGRILLAFGITLIPSPG